MHRPLASASQENAKKFNCEGQNNLRINNKLNFPLYHNVIRT